MNQKTVRVRIAVAINDRGAWSASGYLGASDGQASAIAIEGIDPTPNEAVHFVEADVPVPVSATIEGEVSGSS